MSPELQKALLAFGGAATGAVAGAYFKAWFDSDQQRRRLRKEQEQTRWLPVLDAARALKKRLEDLTGIYRRTRSNLPFSPDTVAADFRELYVLRRGKVDLNDSDGNEPRHGSDDRVEREYDVEDLTAEDGEKRRRELDDPCE